MWHINAFSKPEELFLHQPAHETATAEDNTSSPLSGVCQRAFWEIQETTN